MRSIRKSRTSVFCLALAAGVHASDVANDATRDTMELPVVHAESQRIESGPASVNHLDEASLQRFASLEDAVNSLPGFHVRREGGLGGYSELSFRGADAASVEIYLDGLRLNQEGGEAPDLAKLPLLWFSGLEERSGFDAFGAGDPGALSRIDLSTEPAGSSHTELRSRVGSFSTAEGAATVHGGADWKWTAGVEGQTARNDYPFFNDNGTQYNTSDDAMQRLQNNAYWSRGARASVRHDGASLNQSLSLLWLDYLKEYPGIPNTVSNPQAYTRRSEWMGAWRVEADPGRSVLEAGVQAHHFDDSYRDPNQSLGYLSYEEARAATSIEADARAKLPVTKWLMLSADSRLSEESVEPTVTPYDQAFVSPSAKRNEIQLGMTLQEKITRDFTFTEEVHGDWVRFDADRVQSFPSDTAHAVSRNLTPLAFRAGARWRTSAGDFEILGRYEERSPASEELLGDNNGTRPNLALSPQKTRAWSALHDWDRKWIRFQTGAFWHQYENPIRLQPYGASPFLQYGNGPAYRATGVEEENRIDVKNFESRVSLTLQSLRILEGPAAGYWPAYQSPIEGHVETFWKRQTSFASIFIGPLLDVLGPYYPGDINLPDARRSPEWDWGFHLDARRRRADLALDARNLMDRNERDFAYSVRNGRSYSLSLSINI